MNFYFPIFESYFRSVESLTAVDVLSLFQFFLWSYVQDFFKSQYVQDGRTPAELMWV